MDLLNIVFSILNLLATVIIGVIQVTWMISRDVFRSRPKAKHYFKAPAPWFCSNHRAGALLLKKRLTASVLPQPSGQSFDIIPGRN